MSFSEKEISNWADVAKKAALLAEPILMERFGKLRQVQEKEQAGLVSEADLLSEKAITEFLLKETPDFPVLGEEAAFEAENPAAEDIDTPRWVVDPLDGTTNYVHGFSIFCISIGLEYKGEALVGVVHAPALKQMYWAGKGLGAHCNDEKISVSARAELSKALVATGFFTSNESTLKAQLTLFNHVITRVRGIRRAGAAAYDLAMVAHGVFDAFWEKNLNPWDTCAGHCLVEEAGGTVTTFEGSTYSPFRNSILASNGKIHSSISGCLQE